MDNRALTQELSIVTKKLDDTLVVWFGNSHSFLLLDPPAALVLRKLQQGEDAGHMEKCLRKHFSSYGADVITGYISEISGIIASLNRKVSSTRITPDQRRLPVSDTGAAFTRTYKMGNKSIRIIYQHGRLFQLIHPMFAHLTTGHCEDGATCLALLQNDNCCTLFCDGRYIQSFPKDYLAGIKGALLKQLYSIISNKSEDQWMLTAHAASIACNGNAVLFPASGGSGKSTLAALLQSQGYRVLSDDFIAVDRNGRTYSFPAAISIKAGAANKLAGVVPSLQDIRFQNYEDKKVKFLPNSTCPDNTSYPVRAMVLVQYAPGQSFLFERLSPKDALHAVLKESWIQPDPDNVSRFFDWFAGCQFYTLKYSENADAFRSVSLVTESISE